MTVNDTGMTWVDARAVLEELAGIAGHLAEHADQMPDDVKLPELVRLIGTVDQVGERLATVRDVLAGRARPAFGWKANRYADPATGWKAERVRSVAKTWDYPRAFGRLAAVLRVDPETGEMDVNVEPPVVELLLTRFARLASFSGLKVRALGDLGVRHEDLLTVEEQPRRIRVVRDVPADSTGGES